jgi:hypothetical protein
VTTKKQESLKETFDKLLTEYKLTELEVNALFAIQGLILERIMKEKNGQS